MRTVFRYQPGGLDQIPAVQPLRPLQIADWFAEQGIPNPTFVNRIDVVEDGDSMTAFIDRMQTSNPSLSADGKVTLLPDGYGRPSHYIQAYPVTSITLLLAQYPAPQSFEEEFPEVDPGALAEIERKLSEAKGR